MQKTKKEFKEYLNKKYGFIARDKSWHGNCGAKLRLYGDYIYSSDKCYFDVLYIEWLKDIS